MTVNSKTPYIELTQSEFVNISAIDTQHQLLGEFISELYELLGTNKPETIKFLLNRLVQHLRTHFETEEDLMKKFNYINFFSHRMEHERFLRKILNFKEKFDAGKEVLNLELLKSCKNWFHNHIELNDKKLGAFLTENSIK